ncbi:MAG: TlpA family protein disulfide reductase [Chloroflexota bacterium]
MWPRLSIVTGLLAGVAAAALLLGAAFVLAPEPGNDVTPLASTAPSPAPPASSAGGASAGAASGGAGSSGFAVPSAAGSPDAAGAAFGVGRPAPALVVPQVGGGTIDLAALKGKPVWVNFMGTYCPPCQDEFPLMNGFAARYDKDGLVVVAVDVKEDEGTVASFAQALSATFPIGLDQDGSVSTAWRTGALPEHFWIDRGGIVRHGALGGIGADEMARGLRSILPGVDVTT